MALSVPSKRPLEVLTTKSVFEKNGSLYTKDEKVYLNSTKFGDDSDRVVVRENGIPTYFTINIIITKSSIFQNQETAGLVDTGVDKAFDICKNDSFCRINDVTVVAVLIGNKHTLIRQRE